MNICFEKREINELSFSKLSVYSCKIKNCSTWPSVSYVWQKSRLNLAFLMTLHSLNFPLDFCVVTLRWPRTVNPIIYVNRSTVLLIYFKKWIPLADCFAGWGPLLTKFVQQDVKVKEWPSAHHPHNRRLLAENKRRVPDKQRNLWTVISERYKRLISYWCMLRNLLLQN